MIRSRICISTMTAIVLAIATLCLAQPYGITWSTVDTGGVMYSTNGTFSVGGTGGQPDAGPPTSVMTGGNFSLVGGFWVVADTCSCPGDMNGDGLKDGRDVQKFVNCLMSGGSCSCADVDGSAGVTLGDVATFVNDLVSGVGCP